MIDRLNWGNMNKDTRIYISTIMSRTVIKRKLNAIMLENRVDLYKARKLFVEIFERDYEPTFNKDKFNNVVDVKRLVLKALLRNEGNKLFLTFWFKSNKKSSFYEIPVKKGKSITDDKGVTVYGFNIERLTVPGNFGIMKLDRSISLKKVQTGIETIVHYLDSEFDLKDGEDSRYKECDWIKN